MAEQERAVLSVDGVETFVDELDVELQRSIAILNRWRVDQENAHLAKMQIDMAVRSLTDHVVAGVRKHREDLNAEAANVTEVVEPVVTEVVEASNDVVAE